MSKLIPMIQDDTSPLFNIKSIFNYENKASMKMMNNILCCHIGNGVFISVAHNLKSNYGIPLGVPNSMFETEFLACFNQSEKAMIRSKYDLDVVSNKQILKPITDKNEEQMLKNKLNSCSFDTTYAKSYARDLVKPFLITQFKIKSFFGDDGATRVIDPNKYFHQQNIKKHFFLVELELVKTIYEQDIAIYQAVNTAPEIIAAIPKVEVDFTAYDGREDIEFYCLQSSPTSELGRFLNKAIIDGISEHNSIQANVNPPTVMEGLRYIMKGYFRFGSSGAPYLVFDEESETLKINAVQSEACPQQLLINGNQKGNAQYINGIATPLANVQEEINEILNLPV